MRRGRGRPSGRTTPAPRPDCLRVGFEPKGSTHTYYQVFDVVGAALFPADLTVSVGGGPAGPALIQQVTRVPRITRITDGTVDTIGVVECGPPVPWTKPADIVIADLSKPLPPLAWRSKRRSWSG